MAVLDNPRHEKFAQGLAMGMSQRKAYRVAFPKSERWKDETVDTKACNLAGTDKVLTRLRELAVASSSEAVMNAKERKEWLSDLIREKEGLYNASEKLKAVDILNKMDGEYTEKVQLAGEVNNPMAGLTTEELKKLVYSE